MLFAPKVKIVIKKKNPLYRKRPEHSDNNAGSYSKGTNYTDIICKDSSLPPRSICN